MRAKYGGTVIKYDNELKFIDTSSDHIGSAGAYPSWHPSGKFIAFSVNRINQDFHSSKEKIAYVQDKYSDIVLYDVENNVITRPGALATGARENLPTWSPDGKQLYFISAPKSTDSTNYENLRYSLLRIGFDPATKSFGKIDTILDAERLHKSISFPRVAPDNNTICFCLLDYGYFSIYNPESDIYTYRLDSKKMEQTEANSPDVESYPSWSQNGRWLMFVSKREDGILSKVYFCHTDEQGKTTKPFVAPQRDPDFYSSYLLNFNRPEFASARIDLNPRKVLMAAREEPLKTLFDEANSVTITTGATTLTMEQPEGIYQSDR
jgi:Tol biopolymer transport system component